MSGYAMEWAAYIADQKQLDPAATLVLIRIAEHAHRKSGRANPSAITIAAETRYTERGVREAMCRLREAKVVDCDVRVGRSAVWWFPTAPPRKHVPGLEGELSTPRKQVPGYPGTSFRTPRNQAPLTPERRSYEQEEQELSNKKAPAAVAALPGDDNGRPNPRPGPDAMFAPGSGWITDWTKGR